jgi:hypothetical protein
LHILAFALTIHSIFSHLITLVGLSY